ncbi:hypothetical protein ACTMU2_12235 [Cupriavidus basilensis]
MAGLVVSFIDITAIRQAERQREQMLRFLSHDMRSPQASILALIDLHRPAAGEGESADLLARIGTHARAPCRWPTISFVGARGDAATGAPRYRSGRGWCWTPPTRCGRRPMRAACR